VTTPRLAVPAALLALAATAARAGEHRLTEADLCRAIPVLRAEGAVAAGAQALAADALGARERFSGDPLEWLRRRARVDLPAAAAYQARCSRAASVEGGPVALFTFGRRIDCVRRAWRDAPRTQRNPEADMTDACRAEGARTDRFLDGLQAALAAKGYTVDEEGDAYRRLSSPGGGLQAVLHPHNVYDRANRPEDHPLLLRLEAGAARDEALAACSAIDSGPLLELRAGDGAAGPPADAVAAALRAAGLEAERYEAIKEALFLARADVEQGLLALEAQVAALQGGDARRLETRRANADLYLKRAADLSPLLDGLVPGVTPR
jgi:hypothetical protein